MQKASDNDIFITLIRVAEEDRKLALRILAITKLPEVERKIRVLQLINDCQQDGAPADFIAALSFLGENAIARKVSELLDS